MEQFIVRRRTARYLFVLVAFPIEWVRDRVGGVWNPVDRRSLTNALGWARRGGDPAEQPPRPEPAPASPRWAADTDQGVR